MRKILVMMMAAAMSFGAIACSTPTDAGSTAEPTETAETAETAETTETAEVSENSETETPDGEETEDPKEEIVETEEYVDSLHTDDETLVYKVGGVKIVFNHEGEKITRYAVYQDCGTEEAAKEMLNNAFEAEAGDGFGNPHTKPSKLHTVGRYFAFQYDDDTFLDSIPLESVKEKYSVTEEVKDEE